jgi:hypothetical protein
MQQSLTLPESRLRFLLKTILFVSILLTVFHFFPKWAPSFLSDISKSGWRLFSNGSTLQAALIIFLLWLIIGDLRRFGVLMRVFIAFLVVDLVVTIFHFTQFDYPNGEIRLAYWAVGLDILFIVVLLILNRSAGRARYNLKYFRFANSKRCRHSPKCALPETATRGSWK